MEVGPLNCPGRVVPLQQTAVVKPEPYGDAGGNKHYCKQLVTCVLSTQSTVDYV
jgi:hypothetical protein